jgi:hypothetical protein
MALNELHMSNSYSVVFKPPTWQTFNELPKKALGFRLTLEASLKKIEIGDVLICYLAERMTWCGALRVSAMPYKSCEHIYAKNHGLPLILEVDPICILGEESEIPVKTKQLWDSLDRFKFEDHRVNGWAVKVGLIRSLRKLSHDDSISLQTFLQQRRVKGKDDFRSIENPRR